MEALLVGAGEVVVRARGQLVLRLAGDAPLQRRERGVLAHRELRAGLAVLGDVEADVAGTDRAERLEPARGVLGGVDLHQLAAQLVADRDRRVGGGVGAAGDARVDDAERDLVGHLDRRLQPGAAGLLDVGGGGLGREPGAEHALAGEVEVARVLEHRSGDDLAEPLALAARTGRRGRRWRRSASPGWRRRRRRCWTGRTGCGCRRRRRPGGWWAACSYPCRRVAPAPTA